MNKCGQYVCKRLLCVIGMRYPHIAFANLLPDIVAISVSFQSEEKTYNLISRLIEVEESYLFLKKKHYHAFLTKFRKMVKKRTPKLKSHFKSINLDMEILGDQLFGRFFLDHLPYYLVVQIFTIYINEGLKILYRAGLAILKRFKKEILEINQPEIVYFLILERCRQITDVSKFLSDMFNLKLSKKITHGYKRDHNPLGIVEPTSTFYFPKIDHEISLFPSEYFEIIYEWLPKRYRIRDPVIVFHSSESGYSMKAFMKLARDVSPNFLILKSRQQKVFGFFMNNDWSTVGEVCGDHSTFVFTLQPGLQRFPARGLHSDSHVLIKNYCSGFDVGISHSGFAISIDEDWHVISSKCEIFDSPPLNGDEYSDKKDEIVEICLYTFV